LQHHPHPFQEDHMKNEKKQDKKTTLRPWLVDVVVDNVR
jgi:hypothetical protein